MVRLSKKRRNQLANTQKSFIYLYFSMYNVNTVICYIHTLDTEYICVANENRGDQICLDTVHFYSAMAKVLRYIAIRLVLNAINTCVYVCVIDQRRVTP